MHYVEAHGTGTALGDPMQLEALGAVLGEGRAAGRPLVVASVKTNIGHPEAASGVAGLIKVALALRARRFLRICTSANPAGMSLGTGCPYDPDGTASLAGGATATMRA